MMRLRWSVSGVGMAWVGVGRMSGRAVREWRKDRRGWEEDGVSLTEDDWGAVHAKIDGAVTRQSVATRISSGRLCIGDIISTIVVLWWMVDDVLTVLCLFDFMTTAVQDHGFCIVRTSQRIFQI